jgi:4-hydroxybenzoate polyprenyltransferase
VLWDVFVIAAGFVLRALAGAFAAPVPISTWFYLCATFLALFLALAKRRSELVRAQGDAERQRTSLAAYTVQLLDQLLVVVVACTLMTYSLYTFQSETASHGMMLTIPFVIFGVFRYLYLIYARGEGERPDELLWRDRQVLGAVVCCVVVVVAVLYGVPALAGHGHPPA